MLVQPKKFNRVRRHVLLLMIMTCVSFMMLLVLRGPAWSFNIVTPDRDRSPITILDHNTASPQSASDKTALTSSSAAGVEDPCLPLLKAVRYSAGSSSPPAVNQRSIHGDAAGRATALGLIIGVRFALGPQESNGSSRRRPSARLDVWQPNDNIRNPHALAVADYRDCRKDQALKALSNWRWSR